MESDEEVVDEQQRERERLSKKGLKFIIDSKKAKDYSKFVMQFRRSLTDNEDTLFATLKEHWHFS